MALRKVLLLTYHFPPSGAVAVYRMLGLVRYLPRFGWQPVVVAPPRVPWEPADPSLLEQVPAGTPVERVPFLGGFAGKVVSQFAPEAHWLVPAWAACRRMIEQHQPAAVITSSPPGVVHLLGRRIQKRYGLPWVACFRDPWIVNSFSTPDSLASVYRSFEADVMARADQLVANTPANLRGWSAAYPAAASRMVTITNGFDPENFVHGADPAPPGERVRILHAGELYAGRDPRPFLAALGQVNAAGTPVEAEFLGRNTEHAFNFSAEVRQLGLGGIVSTPGQVPYDVSLEKMQRADILLLFQRTGYNMGIPAKLYEYLGAGRAILAVSEPDSDIAWVLRESKVLHRVAAPTDVPGIHRALTELIADVRAGRPAVPDPAALAAFTRERMASRFAECLDRLTPAVGTAPTTAPTRAEEMA